MKKYALMFIDDNISYDHFGFLNSMYNKILINEDVWYSFTRLDIFLQL